VATLRAYVYFSLANTRFETISTLVTPKIKEYYQEPVSEQLLLDPAVSGGVPEHLPSVLGVALVRRIPNSARGSVTVRTTKWLIPTVLSPLPWLMATFLLLLPPVWIA